MTRRVGALVCVVTAALLGAACSSGTDAPTARATGSLRCDWPMYGRDISRTFAYPSQCESALNARSVSRLAQQWFYKTADVVTATPAIVGGTAFVGDWSGRFYAISLAEGRVRWTFSAPLHKNVYSGQIVSSAAVADVAGERRVFFASGKTLYALNAADGELRWKHELNPEGDADDVTEIQSSPAVARGMVIVGYDGHDTPGTRAGLVAVDAGTGRQRWNFDPDRGAPPTGCGGIWGSPSVDTALGLVFSGTANCPTSPKGWNGYSEAIFAVDLETGVPKWSFQPRGPSNNDFDFAGAPNLFAAGGKRLVGLGGKDGVYYALDRATGKVAWKTVASTPRVQAPNFSTGGFIGATAIDDGIVVGGTAIGGPCPCLHGIRADTGAIAWRQSAAAPTFASSAIVNGVAFAGSTTDFTLRAVDLRNGKVLWSQELVGGIAGGVAVAGDNVVAVAGIREPGVEAAGTESGVYLFAPGPAGAPTTTDAPQGTLPPTTAAPPATAADPNPPPGAKCIAAPCTLDFSLKEPAPGLDPTLTIHLRPQPFRIEVRAADLGEPEAWLRKGSPTVGKGAVTYAVFASDDSLKGSLLCVLDANFDCVNTVAPANARPNYNRISVLAIADTPELPSSAEGFDRLVTTVALEHPVTLN